MVKCDARDKVIMRISVYYGFVKIGIVCSYLIVWGLVAKINKLVALDAYLNAHLGIFGCIVAIDIIYHTYTQKSIACYLC